MLDRSVHAHDVPLALAGTSIYRACVPNSQSHQSIDRALKEHRHPHPHWSSLVAKFVMALDAGALPTDTTTCDLTVDFDLGAAAKRWPVGDGAGFESVVPIDLTLNDERRLKQELVAWAKAVASMAIRASVQC
uniref:Uncharacterized protein n=1 Tax=Avena sativa TaxID=4498 RepID=A0ACD5UQ76_AVESA